jgi:hypothetical protein
VQDTLAEDAPTDWRPLFSYASNLNRIGDAAFGTDAAYVTVNRAFNASQAEMTAMLGVASGPWSVGMPPPPTDDRRFANQNVLQYPWTWSASVLAALLGISLCILSTRVKSLDRLR